MLSDLLNLLHINWLSIVIRIG